MCDTSLWENMDPVGTHCVRREHPLYGCRHEFDQPVSVVLWMQPYAVQPDLEGLQGKVA